MTDPKSYFEGRFVWRMAYIPEDRRQSPPDVYPEADLLVWNWERNGCYWSCAFRTNWGSRVEWYNHWNTAEERDEAVAKAVKRYADGFAYQKARRAEQKRLQATWQHGIRPGDIFVESWGYDQTIIDFYQITAVRGKEVELRRIAKRHRSSDLYVYPLPGRFTETPIRRRPRRLPNGEPAIHIKHGRYAFRWDGKPQYETPPNWA